MKLRNRFIRHCSRNNILEVLELKIFLSNNSSKRKVKYDLDREERVNTVLDRQYVSSVEHYLTALSAGYDRVRIAVTA